MGGFGSGRHSNRSLAEAAFTLDVNWLLRQGIIQAGSRVSGTLRWHGNQTGDQRNIRYEPSLLDPKAASVRLKYPISAAPQDYRVRLTPSPCHYGSYRWWWVCPVSGRRAATLYLPPGATVF